MRIIFLFLIVCFTAYTPAYTQRALLNPLIDSKEIISKAVPLHDDGKYKEAIELYLKVPQSDTSYATVLHELILSYYLDSNYVQAEKYCHTGLSLFPQKKLTWYGFLANVYDDTKRTELALSVYDSIVGQNPHNFLAWFNKGITLFRQSRYDEALPNFQRCAMINPYYTSAHYYLGQLALLKGNMVQAMLSFSTNLLIAPTNQYQKKSISFLQTISEVNTTANEYLQKYKPGKEDNFEEIQDILTSKASLDKKYKLKADLEDPIVRQLQVVIEKLEYSANDKGFWMQYYVPLFKNLWDNGMFEPMVFNMFSEVDIKSVKEYNNKEKKKISLFATAASTYLNEIRETQVLNFTKRETAPTRYYIEKSEVVGKGSYTKNSKNESILSGPWTFHFDNGQVRSKGNFAGESARSGAWHYYYDNGILKELTSYKDGQAHGKSDAWNDNGLPYTTGTYADDKLQGIQTSYLYSGNISSSITYKAGKKEGPAKYYDSDGSLKTITYYVNDLQEGDQVFYHTNGSKASEVKYVKDYAEGIYKEYHENGKTKSEGSFLEGKKTGKWKSYYDDTKPEKIENFEKGELDGEALYYYSNGQIARKSVYKKGQVDGLSQDFDDDGILFSEGIYEKGRLRDLKFLDKKGTIISNTTSRKGNANIAFYSPEGTKQSEGYYSKEGLGEGEFNYYYKNGKLSAKGIYKEGMLEGKKTFYYPTGQISQEGSYKEDEANGYFVSYHINGQVSEEGWYVNDNRQGTFIYYDLLGNITSKIYYINDKVHGQSEYFNANKHKNNVQFFDYGWFNKIEQFDTTGKLMISSALDKGAGKVRFNHFNGSTYFVSSYKFYQLNGPYLMTNGDGSKKVESFYKNGNSDSTYMSWHPNGKIQTEGKYSNGKKTGTWKYYYYSGKLFEVEIYKDGALDGKDVQYNQDGAIEKELNYKKGELEGELKYFGDNSQLILVYYYKKNVLLGYSYEDKTGKLLPMIPLKNERGTVDAYYKNGTKSAHLVFDEGNSNGDRIHYFSNGKVFMEGKRINGLDDGLVKIYYPSGKIMKEDNFYIGERHGSSKYYNEDGSLQYHLNYYLGELHGECKYFNAGKPAATYQYYYGLLETKK